ncbi:LAFE_0G01838g1_1 [Lachancea fermentati]|uniref:LAFE_0G01838g1_1 n=1 Tax=Lachancea fermentati TaxID=4955 RepID=A0A1G4MGN7_LACFM|nr:LAFE_0G01838g1_1 [Lachancea fermentati]
MSKFGRHQFLLSAKSKVKNNQETEFRLFNMNEAEDDDFFSDDDDLLEEFSKRPPRGTSANLSFTNGGIIAHLNDKPPAASTLPDDVLQKLADMEARLVKAQGEASMLRDKLNIFQTENEQERKTHVQKKKELEQIHREEVNRIKADLQKAEDEKKFLIMAEKAKNRSLNPTPVSAQSAVSESESGKTKKRKLEEPSKETVGLNPHRVFPDEVGLFVDSLLQFRLAGSEMTVIEILSQICLEHITEFKCKTFELSAGQSIGERILSMLRLQKESLVKLDKLIDVLLETLASLIKEISYHKSEYRTALPFLVALMYHTITFRPSAVHIYALKDLFQFTGDLIRTNRRVLKRPLANTDSTLDVKPEIFQYELIDNLVVFYSFDIFERSFKVLQTQSLHSQAELIDQHLLEIIEDLTRYSLSISYQPILNVVYSSVEILNSLANIILENPQLKSSVPEGWWNNMIYRLYYILNKNVSNMEEYLTDSSCISFPAETNVFGLIRNIGDNYCGPLVSKLVRKDKLQSAPEVILKNFVTKKGITEKSLNVEWWCLMLKIGIIKLLEKLSIIRADQPLERELLKNLVRLLATEQELLLTVLLGQDSQNMHLHFDLLTRLIKLIFQLWRSGRIASRYLKEVEPELTVCLWRIVFGTDQEDTESIEMSEHKKLVDRLDELQLQEDVDLFDDAFDEEVPKYIEEEFRKTSFLRCQSIMGSGIERNTKDMAKSILESITSMEDADALYLAMYQGS